MKKSIYLFLVPLLLVFFSCEKEEFLEFTKPEATIQFDNYPGYSANFTTVDEVIVSISAEGAENLQVQAFLNDSLLGYSESASQSSLVIEESWASILGEIQVDTLDDDYNLVLRATATVNGNDYYRELTLTNSNPLSLDFSTNDTTDFITAGVEFPDSTFNFYYNVKAENATIERVNFFVKKGKNSTFSSTPFDFKEIGSTSEEQITLTFDFPDEDSVSVGDTLFFKAVAVAESGLTADLVKQVESIEVPLSDEGEFILFPDDYVISPSVADDPDTDTVDETTPAVVDTDNNGFDFSESSLVSDASDSADIRLDVNLGQLEITVDAGVEYVISDGTKSVNGFQSARDVFEAGTPQTNPIGNLAQISANANAYIVFSIPDLANVGTGSSEYVVLRIEDVNLNATVVESGVDAINNSTVSFSFEAYLP